MRRPPEKGEEERVPRAFRELGERVSSFGRRLGAVPVGVDPEPERRGAQREGRGQRETSGPAESRAHQRGELWSKQASDVASGVENGGGAPAATPAESRRSRPERPLAQAGGGQRQGERQDDPAGARLPGAGQ